MTDKEILEVVQGAINGEIIQIRIGEDWVDISNPSWNFGNARYRIKPGITWKKYPSAIRLFRDLQRHGEWVRNIESGRYVKLMQFDDSEVITSDNLGYTYEGLLEKFTWGDGGKCGIHE